MKYTLAADARPQVNLLLAATLISVGLWVVSWFLPFFGYIVYPLQLFATFIHEGSHALVTFMTGNTVLSLTVSPDASGVVWSQATGFSALFISSAGYLGATAYGALLLVWMRFGYSSRLALALSAGFVGIMTFIFGFIAPFWNLLANVTFGSVVFTILSGVVLTTGLLAIAKFARAKWANFALAFLAVQCLLNALFSLKDLFFISTTTNQSSDAANMALATGVPAVLWVVLWIGISIAVITIGLRMYASVKGVPANDSVFEDQI